MKKPTLVRGAARQRGATASFPAQLALASGNHHHHGMAPGFCRKYS